MTGSVRRIETYGAYVGIDGTTSSGLLHVSNLSGRYIETVDEVLQVGDRISAIVMGMEDGYRYCMRPTCACALITWTENGTVQGATGRPADGPPQSAA